MEDKQECPLSPKFFGLWSMNWKKWWIWLQQVTLLLLDVDAMIIFPYNDVDGMQHLLWALETFYQSSELTVNMDKTKLMVVWTIEPHQYHMLTYKGEHVEFV